MIDPNLLLTMRHEEARRAAENGDRETWKMWNRIHRRKDMSKADLEFYEALDDMLLFDDSTSYNKLYNDVFEPEKREPPTRMGLVEYVVDFFQSFRRFRNMERYHRERMATLNRQLQELSE